MRIKPSAEDRDAARLVFEQFKQKPGADHIASYEALCRLAAILRCHNIQSAVEFGAGIGTLTYLLLTYPSSGRKVVSTENNSFCIDQLAVNIPGELAENLTIVSERGKTPQGRFDLAILDGKTSDISPILREDLIVFIEGGRDPQRRLVIDTCEQKGLYCKLHYNAARHLPRAVWKTRWRLKRPFQLDIKTPRIKMPRPGKKLFAYSSGCWLGLVKKG